MTALSIHSLTKKFGGAVALENLTLELPKGAMLALLGPNGSGKSTLFGCLLGWLTPDSGKMLWNGSPIRSETRARFGYVSERVALYPQRTVWENGRFFAALKNQGDAELERQLKRVGLYPFAQRKVRQLSKGMLQRLGLAIALCGNPDLLILDEPFTGLDPAWLEGLQNILRQEQDRGATLILVTHTISAVEHLASHLAILLYGELAEFGLLDEVQERHPGANLESIYHQLARASAAQPEAAL